MKSPQQTDDKILFVTRKFPPSVGGMEKGAYELYSALHGDGGQVDLVAWGGGKKWLPAVYFWLFGRALASVLRRRPDVIFLHDGVLAPMGWALKLLSRRPTLIRIHGLDITYSHPAYRLLILPFISKQTALVTASEGARQAAVAALGRIADERTEIIHDGLRDVFYSDKPRDEQLRVIAQETGLPIQMLERNRLLVTTGRLIKRKGVSWFVNNVMPRMVAENPRILYLIGGSGPQRAEIEMAIERHGLENNVKLLGRVSDECLNALYNVADVFLMPNVHVPNDMEGFGLVAVEAASCGAMVVASDLEGISDAVVNGITGYLVPARDALSYAAVISRELAERSQSRSAIRRHTLEHYSWAETARAYRSLVRKLALNGVPSSERSGQTPTAQAR